MPELVIVVDHYAWANLSGRFKWELRDTVLRVGRWLGISLWSFVDAANAADAHGPRTNPDAFNQIIAHRVHTSAESRLLLGNHTAATLRVPGQAYLLTREDPDEPTLFTVTAPNT